MKFDEILHAASYDSTMPYREVFRYSFWGHRYGVFFKTWETKNTTTIPTHNNLTDFIIRKPSLMILEIDKGATDRPTEQRTDKTRQFSSKRGKATHR